MQLPPQKNPNFVITQSHDLDILLVCTETSLLSLTLAPRCFGLPVKTLYYRLSQSVLWVLRLMRHHTPKKFEKKFITHTSDFYGENWYKLIQMVLMKELVYWLWFLLWLTGVYMLGFPHTGCSLHSGLNFPVKLRQEGYRYNYWLTQMWSKSEREMGRTSKLSMAKPKVKLFISRSIGSKFLIVSS